MSVDFASPTGTMKPLLHYDYQKVVRQVRQQE